MFPRVIRGGMSPLSFYIIISPNLLTRPFRFYNWLLICQEGQHPSPPPPRPNISLLLLQKTTVVDGSKSTPFMHSTLASHTSLNQVLLTGNRIIDRSISISQDSFPLLTRDHLRVRKSYLFFAQVRPGAGIVLHV